MLAALRSFDLRNRPHLQTRPTKLLRLMRWKASFWLKQLAALAILTVVLSYMGVFTHILEKDYDTQFSYPLEINVAPLLQELRNGASPEKLNTKPLNLFQFEYLHTCPGKCYSESTIRVLMVIKSAIPNIRRRNVIRQTWGYEKRFSDVEIRRVFILGTDPCDPQVQKAIDEESQQHGDIVQTDFVDSYFNNTLKMMSGFKWALQHCSTAQFVLFSDDDMYISTKNVLRFIRNPSNYPDYLELPVASVPKRFDREFRERSLKQNLVKNGPLDTQDDEQLRRFAVDFGEYQPDEDLRLYAGFVFHSPPIRHRTSKWFVSLDEYPFSLWPPYATAGAFIVSRSALVDLFYTSLYTKMIRFDDVFLGLVARKAQIDPIHNEHFYFWKKTYTPDSYQYVIASHGYEDADELSRVWNQQKSIGHA